jgi:hypothetical protein
LRALLSVALALATLTACSAEAPTYIDGWRVAFEDPETGRIAVCGINGEGFEYITPDSLWAAGPVSDSTGKTVYFFGQPRDREQSANALFAVEVDGSYLRKITDLPLRALDIQVTPDGGKIVFTGRYPDQELPRAYEFVVGVDGFRAVSPANRGAYDPGMAPGGLNFVHHDSSFSDTLQVSSLQQILTIPIAPFPYTQTTIRPDGNVFVSVCGENRRGLCSMALKTREERILVAESDEGAVSHPVFNWNGDLVVFVYTEAGPKAPTSIRIISLNSMEIIEIPLTLKTVTHPAWVR